MGSKRGSLPPKEGDLTCMINIIVYQEYIGTSIKVWCFTQSVRELMSKGFNPREEAGGLSREYILRIPSVS